MNKRTITVVIIATVLLLAGLAIGGFFVIRQGGSQTVGEVTVNRPAGSVEIKEVAEPAWNQATLSPVIGKAYRIDRIKNDDEPVRIEFAYDPAKIPKGIRESDLRLFKKQKNKEGVKSGHRTVGGHFIASHMRTVRCPDLTPSLKYV